MSSEGVKEVIPKVLTTKTLILTVILTLTVSMVNEWGYGAFGYNWAGAYTWIEPLGFTFVLIVILAALSRVSPSLRFSPQEMTIISSAVILTYMFQTITTGSFIPPFVHIFYYDRYAQARPYVPSWLTPSTDPKALEGFYVGGPIPWGMWVPILSFWVVLLIGLTLLNIGFSTIFMKRYIEVEALPFPYMLSLYQGIRILEVGLVESFTKLKWLWVGIAIGFWYSLRYVLMFNFKMDVRPPLTYLFLAFPTQTYPGIQDVIPGAFTQVNFYLSRFVLGYLIPYDMGLSASIWGIFLMYILPPILVAAGIPWSKGQVYIHLMRRAKWMFFWTDPMGLAFAIFVIVFAWPIIRDTIQSAIGRKRLPEETGVFNYRNVWIITIVGFVIFTGTLAAIVGPAYSIVYVIFMLLFSVTLIWWGGLWFAYHFSVPTRPIIYGIGQAIAGGADAPRGTHPWGWMSSLMYSNSWDVSSTLGPAQTFRLASYTKTNFSELLKAMLIIAVLVSIVAPFQHVWLNYAFGGLEKGQGGAAVQRITAGLPAAFRPWGDVPADASMYWGSYIISLILVGAVMYARSRWAWFFFNPFVWVPFSFGPWYMNYISIYSIIIATIIKGFVFKYLGTKFHQEVMIPLMAGIYVGIAALGFLSGLGTVIAGG